LTKAWALDALAPGPCSEPDACIDLVAGVRFNLVFNTGAAFTRGSGYGPLIGVLALVMTGVLIFLSTRRQDRFGIVLFGALAGGAVGNLLDRIFRADDGPLSGAVIDFIDVGWWPVFNVADMAIVIGVVAIIAHAFVVGEPEDLGLAEDRDDRGDVEAATDTGDMSDVDTEAMSDTDTEDDADAENDSDSGSGVETEVVPGPSNDRSE